MKIFLGADHRGFKKKNQLLKFLSEKGYEVKDEGAVVFSETDDYNDPAIAVARAVRETPKSVGILICGSAHGMLIQANRFRHIRAISATEPKLIKLGRIHNDANILCLSADFLSLKKMKQFSTIFIKTDFDGVKNHTRRNNRLDERKDYD